MASMKEIVEDRIAYLAIKDHHKREDESKQTVTLRLDPVWVARLDSIAECLEMSRQQVMHEIMTNGVEEAAKALANQHPEKNRQKVFMEIMKYPEAIIKGAK